MTQQAAECTEHTSLPERFTAAAYNPLDASTHHTSCAPDVSRGAVPRPYQHLQGSVLSCLDVFSEVLVLNRRNVLLTGQRLFKGEKSIT